MSAKYVLKRQTPNVFRVEMSYRAGWEQWFLLASDHHFDNPHSDHKLIKKHLEQAKEKNAGVIFVGDWFCCMESRGDLRGSKALRKKDIGMDYLDNLVESSCEFLEPYADMLMVIGMGNHETAILKRHETNLTERLCSLLKYKTGHSVYNGQYGGFIRFMFHQDTSGGFKGGRMSKVLHYYHGSGGGSLMTKGVNKHMQRLTFVPDADFIVMGHTHNEFLVTQQRLRLSQKGKIYQDECMLINTATYKDEHKEQLGWAVEKGLPPKPKGAWWLRFYYDQYGSEDKRIVKAEVLRAK